MPGSGELIRAARVGLVIGAALLTLALSARLLRIHEFTEATARILRRVMPARR